MQVKFDVVCRSMIPSYPVSVVVCVPLELKFWKKSQPDCSAISSSYTCLCIEACLKME